MTFDPNINTILDGVIIVAVCGVWRQFRAMNGTLREICEWRRGHMESHTKDWVIQRELCNVRHGRRSYDSLVPQIIAERGQQEET